jgi:hypothetical protein
MIATAKDKRFVLLPSYLTSMILMLRKEKNTSQDYKILPKRIESILSFSSGYNQVIN